MQLDHNHHLAYCTNIHPAESWVETLGALQKHTLMVRDQISPHDPYAIGLRLSARAADELLQDDHLSRFEAWLAREHCYVFTINGFPYGAFHGTRVKENVYRPDWSTPERLHYTNQLFDIISRLAPDGVDGSVSTLPGSFKAFHADESVIFANLESCARHLEALSDRTDCDLHLDDSTVSREHAVEDHRGQEQLCAVLQADHRERSGRRVAADFWLSVPVVRKARRDRSVLAVDCNVHYERHAGLCKARPDRVEVRMGEGARIFIRFVGVDHERVTAICQALVHDRARFFRPEAEWYVADRAQSIVVCAEIAHRPVEDARASCEHLW
ncbi:MAG: hypothetical protein ABGZ49_08305, partial [Akkermansiaceae bacterium]